MLLYDSEIWGLDDCTITGNVHVFSFMRFFNVPGITPNRTACRETGRYPLFMKTVIRSFKYWLRLLRMKESQYPRKVYKMMLLDANNMTTGLAK